MTNYDKPLKVIIKLAHEIYGETVIVDAFPGGDGINPSVDIFLNISDELPELCITHKKAYELMIELLRNIKKMNKTI